MKSLTSSRRFRSALEVFVALAVMGCKRETLKQAPPPPPAVLTTVVLAKSEPSLSRRGSVNAGARLRLGFDSPGVLATVNVKTGDLVKKGQLLARLTDGGASATLRAAQANRERASRDFGVTSTLAGQGTLPTKQRDDAQSALRVASANQDVAIESINQRRLLAPIAGTVVQRLAEGGELVSPGSPVIVLDTQVLVVKVGVTERELTRIKVSQAATLVGDDGDKWVKARVSSIGPAPLEDGLYAVEVTPADEDAARKQFRAGALVTVQFAEENRATTIRVPLGAVLNRDGKSWVFVTASTGEAPKASLRNVEVDRIDGSDVIVRAGLVDGDRIIREGVDFVQDGQTVRLVD